MNIIEFYKRIKSIQLLRKTGNLLEAERRLTEIAPVASSHGAFFSEAVKTQLTGYGLPCEPAGHISVRCLGNYGRFGNQILQYMAVRCLSLKLNLIPHTPIWIGNFLFPLPILDRTCNFQEIDRSVLAEIFAGKLFGANFDIGTFLPVFSQVEPFLPILRSDLQLLPRIRISNDLDDLGFRPNSSYVAHLRLGDFMPTKKERIVETERLIFRIAELNLANPIWLCTDSPEAIEECNIPLPSNVRLLAKSIRYPRMDWLYSWMMIRLAGLRILNAPSTFSETATWLGDENSITLKLWSDAPGANCYDRVQAGTAKI